MKRSNCLRFACGWEVSTAFFVVETLKPLPMRGLGGTKRRFQNREIARSSSVKIQYTHSRRKFPPILRVILFLTFGTVVARADVKRSADKNKLPLLLLAILGNKDSPSRHSNPITREKRGTLAARYRSPMLRQR